MKRIKQWLFALVAAVRRLLDAPRAAGQNLSAPVGIRRLLLLLGLAVGTVLVGVEEMQRLCALSLSGLPLLP